MNDTAFDLLERPWVRVRGTGGVREVSLRTVFDEAHTIEALAGEVPTQDAAVLRLLVAVLHRSVHDTQGYPSDAWAKLWRAPTLPSDAIGAYLDGARDRFDLFGGEAPFFQVAGLSAGRTSGLAKIVADVPDGQQYFTTRAGRELESLSFAEAARWLVHLQAFDPSGIKTGMLGDPRVKAGKGYPIGTGWAGRCGLVILEGGSLKETLLLNLVLTGVESDALPDLPVWERSPLGPGIERRHPEPLGPADILTWPSRRVRLVRENDRVVDVLLGNGDPIHARNRQGVEPMTAWRRSPNQEKQHGGTVYMPRQHDPARALWRGLAGILVQRPEGGAISTEAVAELPPANIAWLATLVNDEAIDPAYPVRMRAVGMSYGTQDASIDTVYDDALSMRVAVMSHAGLRSLALAAAATGEAAVQAIGWLAGNLALLTYPWVISGLGVSGGGRRG